LLKLLRVRQLPRQRHSLARKRNKRRASMPLQQTFAEITWFLDRKIRYL